MTLDFSPLKQWCVEAATHPFKIDGGVFLSHQRLSRDTYFGITDQGFLFILLKNFQDEVPFKIHNLLELTAPRSFVSEIDGSTIHGTGLIVNIRDAGSQARLLLLMDMLLSREGFRRNVDEFFELLRKASQRHRKFYSPSLFSEFLVLKKLLPIFPNVVTCWRSSGQSVFDICSSLSHPGIEIKSTTNIDSRRHKLSLHQVRHFIDNPECALASVRVYEDPQGLSCKQVCESLIEACGGEYSPQSAILRSYLVSFEHIEGFHLDRFNEALSASSIVFVRPDFSELDLRQPPSWLCAASFEVDFTSFKPIGVSQLSLD
jgi:hypothetical protein